MQFSSQTTIKERIKATTLVTQLAHQSPITALNPKTLALERRVNHISSCDSQNPLEIHNIAISFAGNEWGGFDGKPVLDRVAWFIVQFYEQGGVHLPVQGMSGKSKLSTVRQEGLP